MSRIIIAYNPIRKISNDIIDRFSIAESFIQSQTTQKTKIHRSFLLNGNAFISVVLKKNQEDQIFIDSKTGLAVFLDGSPLVGVRTMSAKNIGEQYLKVGPEKMASSIDGSWSAVIVEPKNNSILVFRDRFGRVPFYFSKNADFFLASSSPGSLVKSRLMPAEYNANMIARYASSNYMATFGLKESFFKNIFLIDPATFLSFDSNGVITQKQYWRPDAEANYFDDSETLIEENFYNCLSDMIKKYFVVNESKNFGVTLSGGMDSGAIIGLLHRESKKRVKAISMTYSEKTSFDETDLINYSVRDHVSEWTDIKVEEKFLLDDFPNLYSRFDIPLCTVTAYCHEILFRKAVEFDMPVLFSGAGGDALQAGTYPFYLYHLADLKFSDPKKYEHELDSWIKNHSTEIYPKNKNTAETFFSNRIDFTQNGKFKSSPMLLVKDILNDEFQNSVGSLGQPLVDIPGDYLRSYTMQELWYDSNAAFESEDVMCWSWGVDVVSPFFDQKVTNFAWRLPPHHKIKNGINKALARKVLRGIVPNEILNTVAKKGFNAPFDLWARGSLKEFVMDHFRSEKFKSRGIYNQNIFQKCLNDHMDNKVNHMMLIWQALNLELWMRNWIDTDKK